MRALLLPPTHYTASWPMDEVYPKERVTRLGRQYAELPNGLAKEDKYLEIVQSFHVYLIKYLAMILLGHVPKGNLTHSSDTFQFLMRFLPKNSKPTRQSLSIACRTLHLAFKGLSAEEVYCVLTSCLLATVKKYDPFFVDKLKGVVEVIAERLLGQTQIRATDVERYIGLDCPMLRNVDCACYLRSLVKYGFMELVEAPGQSLTYQRSETWPPPAEFFNHGAIGLSYYVPKWFRYNLQDWITHRMVEVEAKDGILQLDYRTASTAAQSASENNWDSAVPHLDGEFVDPHTGRGWAADMTMTVLPVDIGQMSLDWVAGATGPLIASCTRRERYVIYCYLHSDMQWKDIANALGISVKDAKATYETALARIRTLIEAGPGSEPPVLALAS